VDITGCASKEGANAIDNFGNENSKFSRKLTRN